MLDAVSASPSVRAPRRPARGIPAAIPKDCRPGYDLAIGYPIAAVEHELDIAGIFGEARAQSVGAEDFLRPLQLLSQVAVTNLCSHTCTCAMNEL